MKESACCFIGHRPQELHFGYNEDQEDCRRLKVALAREIKAMLDNGVTTFYTGMDMGMDMWCAEIVQSFQEDLPELGIKLNAVIPYEAQADEWSGDDRERYLKIMGKTDETIVLNSHRTQACMHERNRYMVDHSTHIIAVFDGREGETKAALEYARGNSLTVITIDPRTADIQTPPPLRRLTLLKGRAPSSVD